MPNSFIVISQFCDDSAYMHLNNNMYIVYNYFLTLRNIIAFYSNNPTKIYFSYEINFKGLIESIL